ncbi:MAG: hypothetical protein K2K24_02820, partial [Clostridia bacterium]|nr:hypothetical protein [Clostridia bacterium]
QILFGLSLFLLVFKTVEFAAYRGAGKALYPVEFSHLSYFIFGATMVTGVKKMRPFAGICSFFAGVAYLFTTLSASTVYNDAYSIYFMIVSITQHLLLLFAGLVLLFSVDKYSIKDIWISVLGVVAICLFSVLVYNRIIYKDFVNRDNMVIIFMLSGTILKYLLPTGYVIPVALKVFTVIFLFALVSGALVAYYIANNKIFDKREKNGKPLADADYELGIKPLVDYYRNKKTASNSSLQDAKIEDGEDVNIEK